MIIFYLRNLRLRNFMFGLLLVIPVAVNAQSYFRNTLDFDETAGSPAATLEDVKWISGHWAGEAFGGIAEEIWSPPMGSSMMCVFKHVVNGEVTFYEICTISEEDGSLILRLKHFHANLKGWEEKDETHDFRLVKISKNKAYFEGFTFERISDFEITIYVRISNEGKTDEVAFEYKKLSS